MKPMIKPQLLIAVALLSGVAIGYFVRPSAPEAPAKEKGYVARKAVSDRGEDASLRALRRRVAELERQLAEKSVAAGSAVSNAVAGEARGGFGRPRGNPREFLENLRKNDPERYAQMTNRFARWRQRRLERTQSRLEFLSSIDTSHMSAGAKKTHDRLQELIAQREELEEALHQEDLSEERRRELFDQIRATDRTLRELNGKERDNLIEETAKSLGFEGDAAKEISATLRDVVEATGGNGGGGFGQPPPPGGGPGR